jgi:threonine dehydratase
MTDVTSRFDQLRAVDVFAAAARLEGIVRRTRLERSTELSALAAGDVFLKLENEQVTGSFKIRGAYNAIAALPAEIRARGVVASSAGNHGLGVAYAAKQLGIPATVYIPSSAPAVKRKGIADLGATVDATQPDYDAAMAAAKAHGKRANVEYINPCLGDMVLAGQGTVALEIIQSLPNVASIILNVGGGGLLGGIASFVRRVAPHVRIAGAQSVNTAAIARSLAESRVVEIESLPTLADGLAGQIDDYALDIARHGLDEIVTLTEDEIGRGVVWLDAHQGVRAEGAGACAAAAVLFGKLRELPTPAVVLVSGGNIDADRFDELRRRYGADVTG